MMTPQVRWRPPSRRRTQYLRCISFIVLSRYILSFPGRLQPGELGERRGEERHLHRQPVGGPPRQVTLPIPVAVDDLPELAAYLLRFFRRQEDRAPAHRCRVLPAGQSL